MGKFKECGVSLKPFSYSNVKDPPPLDFQKTPLGKKLRKTHGLF